jgi:hypothetical protein
MLYNMFNPELKDITSGGGGHIFADFVWNIPYLPHLPSYLENTKGQMSGPESAHARPSPPNITAFLQGLNVQLSYVCTCMY